MQRNMVSRNLRNLATATPPAPPGLKKTRCGIKQADMQMTGMQINLAEKLLGISLLALTLVPWALRQGEEGGGLHFMEKGASPSLSLLCCGCSL